MAAPSKSYTLIADSSIDADSPIDVTLMTRIRDNLIHLEEWLGNGYTAAQDHDHDGVNSKTPVLADLSVTTAKIAATAVTGAKVSKTIATSGSQAILTGATWTPSAVVGNFINVGSAGTTALELYISGAWHASEAQFVGGLLITDGTNMRFNNTGAGTDTIYCQTF
ncbi:MAG: hypothetical protein AABZ23_06445 [Deltaproteobacteria bacterium]